MRSRTLTPVSVKKTLLRRGRRVGNLHKQAPNRGLDSSFCCCVARQRLTQQECFFTDTGTANPPTNIVDFKGFDSSIILILKGWDSQAHREFPGKLESSNVRRDNVSSEIGRRVNGLADPGDSAIWEIATKSRFRD